MNEPFLAPTVRRRTTSTGSLPPSPSSTSASSSLTRARYNYVRVIVLFLALVLLTRLYVLREEGRWDQEPGHQSSNHDDKEETQAASDGTDHGNTRQRIQIVFPPSKRSLQKSNLSAAVAEMSAQVEAKNPSTRSFGGPRRHLEHPTLHLLGERHSGTTWMTEYLRDCFQDQVDFVRGYSSWKHWFQSEDDGSRRRTDKGSVVVALFRNVLSWTEAMRLNPHHAPLHFDLEWKDFLTTPWTLPRYNEDVILENATAKTHSNLTCRYARKKRPFDIVPCFADRTFQVPWKGGEVRRIAALYELRDDGSGLPFDSILELRSAKIRNFLSVAKFDKVQQLHAVRYEDLVHNGTGRLLRKLEHDLNATAMCQPVKGDRRKMSAFNFDADFLRFMNMRVDWKAEEMIGYSRPRGFSAAM